MGDSEKETVVEDPTEGTLRQNNGGWARLICAQGVSGANSALTRLVVV